MNKNSCIICNSEMKFYFQKEKYCAPSMESFTRNLIPVQFDECSECGFLTSKTHKDLSHDEWEKLNTEFHHFSETGGRDRTGFNQPPYADQAMMIELLACNGLIDTTSMLDYASGYGTLSHIQRKYFNREIPCYDRYVRNPAHQYIDEPQKKAWSTVINSAMFEHVLTRQDLDDVNALVSDTGSLLIHTVVVERVPQDPDWFYTDVPVHTVVHTNRSMSLLMQQWGYQSSIYSPKSKTWALLKRPHSEVKPIVDEINNELQTRYLYSKEGFVDYWK